MRPSLLLAVFVAETLALVPRAPDDSAADANKPSTDPPQPVPAEDVSDFSQAAGLVQQTYCNSTPDGMRIGDGTVLWSYGDGRSIQRSIIYWSKSLGVVLTYEGTDLKSLTSILNDIKFLPTAPDGRYASALPNGSRVFRGFQQALLKSADQVEQNVKAALDKYPGQLTVVGHSQGAGIALLAGVWFRAMLRDSSPSTKVRLINFGLVRTGNQQFADGVDALFPPTKGNSLRSQDFSSGYVVNGRDWVPHAPPQARGIFRHPSGQVWINPANSTNWMRYPGQENPAGANSASPEFPSFDDHQGVYFHTQIGAFKGRCPATVGQD
ncbi:hypothetical protein HIM_06177 [Hirsutella minnesotensis 3608]|uniref:Fungal lipase-type domain-containing protein n=1 Tax=Hirsutella minnesotensis 3608 TaxID=1043627 RepID=A0A0F7ZZK2_9HYPO|nr:hypothetical protein HIM_06177 [Hirsutella minnesotensis 3608]